jgi:aspartyl-tRNA(Asn)/glutamyl-tRNA(Gln) amidotransferase subunit B
VERQTEILESGEKVIQQTRHYDDITDSTKPLRTKEEAHDYRYFPEPDLVPIMIAEKTIDGIKVMIPELPFARIKRYRSEYGLPEYDSKFLAADRRMADYFEDCVSECGGSAKAISNWLMGDFSALLNREEQTIDKSKLTPAMLCRMIEMIDSGKISLKIAKSVFEEMFFKGTDPGEIIKNRGLEQISDEKVLEEMIDKVIEENPGPVQQFRDGKDRAIGFLIGKVMAQTRGQANPKIVNQIITKKLRS